MHDLLKLEDVQLVVMSGWFRHDTDVVVVVVMEMVVDL